MSWQFGSVILGFGLGVFSLVAPMMGIVLPRWLLMLLLGISVLLMIAWPLSYAASYVQNQRTRVVSFIILGAILGATIFGIIATMVPRSGVALSKLRMEAFAIADELKRLQVRMIQDRDRILERHSQFDAQMTEDEKNRRWHQTNGDLMASMSHFQHEFSLLRTRAIVARDSLLKELPDYTKDEADKQAEIVLFTGSLAGPNPAGDVGNYIERLARSLSVE